MPATRRLSRLLVLILAAGLFAAACSSDESDTAAGESESDSASASVSDSASASEPADEASSSDSGSASGAAEDAESDEATAEDDAAATTEDVELDDAEESTSIFPLTLTDAAGQEFTFDEPPVLGCAWYGCVETAAALGVDLFASIVTPEENVQPFYGSGNTEVFITDFTNPEEWAAADVDVILASVAGAGAPNTEAMEQAAPVFYLYYDNFLGDPFEVGGQESYLRNLDLVAQLANQPEAAAPVAADYSAMVATLEGLSTPESAERSIAVIFGMDGYAGLGPDSAFCQLLNETGHGTCVGEGVGAILNTEAFFALDPDLIIHTTFGGETTVADRAANDPIWNQLSAVQAGEVYETDSSRFYCCSTSAQILMAQEYVSLLFPETGIVAPDLDSFVESESPLVAG